MDRDTPRERLHDLVVQMVCGGPALTRASFHRPPDPELVDRCEGFLLFNAPTFREVLAALVAEAEGTRRPAGPRVE